VGDDTEEGAGVWVCADQTVEHRLSGGQRVVVRRCIYQCVNHHVHLEHLETPTHRGSLVAPAAPAPIAGARKTLLVTADSQDSSARSTVMVRSPDA